LTFPKLEVKQVRDNVINEILTTEQSYIRELIVLNRIFKHDMTEKFKTIEISQIELLTLFGNSEQILNVAFQLLQRIVDKFKTWNYQTSTISDIFDEKKGLGTYLRMYRPYANTVDAGVAFLASHGKTRKALKEYFTSMMEDPRSRGLDFASYLTSPVKRIPRYLLLLGELKKFTLKLDPQHPELACIAAAETLLQGVALSVNKSVTDKSKGEEMAQIYLKLKDQNPKWTLALLTPTREFIKEELVFQKQEKKSKLIKCTLYVFNNLILGTPKKQISHWWWFDLENCVIDDPQDAQFCIKITETLAQHKSTTVTIAAKNAAEKSEIIKLIQDNITKAKEAKDLASKRVAPKDQTI